MISLFFNYYIKQILKIKISLLLFGEVDYLLQDFLTGSGERSGDPAKFPINRRPDPFILNWIKHSVLEADFNTILESHMGNDLIELKKEQIICKIDRWVRSNPYDVNYFTLNTQGFDKIYSSEIDDMTCDLANYIWHIFAIYTDNPKISFDQIKDLTGAHISLHHAFNMEQSAHVILEPPLVAVIDKLQEILTHETDTHKKILYQNCILAIEAYLNILSGARKDFIFSALKRPTQKSLRNLFNVDEYIRAYLIMNLLSRGLGFDPLFFDWLGEDLFDKDPSTDTYSIHHKDPSRAWSIFIRDLLITRREYHGVYGSTRQVSLQDTNVLLQGLEMLIERGIDKYKNGVNPNNLITQRDIEEIFSILGGGQQYRLNDGRTVLEWWQQGSSTGVQSQNTFKDRLVEFNKRIKYLVDLNHDYEALIDYLYPTYGPAWISKGRTQLDTYLYMMNHPHARRILHYYVHLEDIDYVRKTWGVWVP